MIDVYKVKKKSTKSTKNTFIYREPYNFSQTHLLLEKHISKYSVTMRFLPKTLVFLFFIQLEAAAMETKNNISGCPEHWVQATWVDMGCLLFNSITTYIHGNWQTITVKMRKMPQQLKFKLKNSSTFWKCNWVFWRTMNLNITGGQVLLIWDVKENGIGQQVWHQWLTLFGAQDILTTLPLTAWYLIITMSMREMMCLVLVYITQYVRSSETTIMIHCSNMI